MLFSQLLGKLLHLLGGHPRREPNMKPSPVPANRLGPAHPLFTTSGQRLHLLQRVAAVTQGGRPLGFFGPLTRANQAHPGLRLGLGALTTQEHLGRRNQRARRRGLWLRDWLRQCYMPPRMAESHRLRSSNTPGLRYWFRPEELALLEPWQKPAHVAGWWQQEASGYLESRYSRNSEMALWVRLMAAYAERFR